MTTPSSSGLPRKTDQRPIHHLTAGAASGFTSAVILQPLDLLKTRLQQSYEGSGPKRRKLAPVVKEVLREDGVLGLWRGTLPTVVRNVPGVAVYFYSLSAIRGRLSQIAYFAVPAYPSNHRALPSQPPGQGVAGPSRPAQSTTSTLVRLSSQGNLIAGAIARTSVGFVLSPFTVLKARYESTRYTEYQSFIGAFRSLLKTSGVRGLFQGFTATAARDAPYAGTSVLIYEKCKDFASRTALPNAVTHSASGATAATLATLLTSPADVVKTRMQVDPIYHPSIRKAIGRIYTDRGVSGFFSGSILRISRKAASSAIAWSVYEGFLLFLRDQGLGS